MIVLVIGIPFAIYTSSVTVSGYVRYWDGTPVENAGIEVHGLKSVEFTDQGGRYKIADVPRNITSLKVTYPINSEVCNYTVDTPAVMWTKDMMIICERTNLTVSGTIYDEYRKPAKDAKVLISHMPSPVLTNAQGQYLMADVPCDPQIPKWISVFIDGERRYMKLFEPLAEDIKAREKVYDIFLTHKSTLNVQGSVKLRDGAFDPDLDEARYVDVEMGGSCNKTDELGDYLLLNVPISTVNYTVEDGDRRITGTIKLPLASNAFGNCARTTIVIDKKYLADA